MKNIQKFVFAILTMFAPVGAHAQQVVADLKISQPVIDKKEDQVTVRFQAEIGGKAAPRNYSLVFGPELTDGTYQWSLPVIIVQGKGAKVSLQRRIYASGSREAFEEARFAQNGDTLHYFASIPYQEWMEGATLSIEALKVGCCSASSLAFEPLAKELQLQPEKEPELVAEAVEPVRPVVPGTTGRQVASQHSFVLSFDHFQQVESVDAFEEILPGALFNEDRENTINIYFAQSRYEIDPGFDNNRQSLDDLMTSIRTLQESADSEVAAVIIAGFASPEGTYEVNDRLAWNRSVSLKEYILSQSSLTDRQIKLYNGSVDWQGLRMLVDASDLPQREAILNIIDTRPVWDPRKNVGRLGELMRLEGGGPYRYMFEHFFPKLRTSAYVRVYYRNKL